MATSARDEIVRLPAKVPPPAPDTAAELAVADIHLYWAAVRSRIKLIAGVTVLTAVATFLICKFLITKYYRAEALLRPEAEQTGVGRLQGIFGASVGIGSLFGGMGPQTDRAEEYMAIFRSFDFTTALITQHGLKPRTDEQLGGFLRSTVTPWKRYKFVQNNFDAEYDRLSGNMTLDYVDRDQEMARRTLSYFIDDLRDRLRKEEIRSADEALDSLQEAAIKTSDSMLRSQIYELISKQVEREKVAQAEADFAFKIIEPPVVPDRPYWPRPVMYAVVMGLLALVVACVGAVIAERRSSKGRSEAGRSYDDEGTGANVMAR